MSNSPWKGQRIIQQVQQEISVRTEFNNGVLVIDQSTDEKAGSHSVDNRLRCSSGAAALKAEHLLNDRQTEWHTLTLCSSEQGMLVADFVRRDVWTTRSDGTVVAETLLIRRDKDRVTYTLTNAPPDVLLQHLAERKSQRSFVKRSIQDTKSELG